MSKRFTLPVFDPCEKELDFSTPDIRLMVDYDDVDHNVVEELMKLIIPALNNISPDEWKAAIRKGRARSELDQ